MRRGLLRDIRAAFDKARGASSDPSEDEDLLALQKELISTLRHLEGEVLGLKAFQEVQEARLQVLNQARLAALGKAVYAFGLGARVRITAGNKAGEVGTVEAISRDYGTPRVITYGVAIPNRGGLYYYHGDEVESAP